jgi:hypothetical protein
LEVGFVAGIKGGLHFFAGRFSEELESFLDDKLDRPDDVPG